MLANIYNGENLTGRVYIIANTGKVYTGCARIFRPLGYLIEDATWVQECDVTQTLLL